MPKIVDGVASPNFNPLTLRGTSSLAQLAMGL